MFHFVSCRLADTLYTTMRLLAVLCLKVFKTAKTDEYGAAVIADNWHDTEAESEKGHDGPRLGDNLCGGFRRNIPENAQTGVSTFWGTPS